MLCPKGRAGSSPALGTKTWVPDLRKRGAGTFVVMACPPVVHIRRWFRPSERRQGAPWRASESGRVAARRVGRGGERRPRRRAHRRLHGDLTTTMRAIAAALSRRRRTLPATPGCHPQAGAGGAATGERDRQPLARGQAGVYDHGPGAGELCRSPVSARIAAAPTGDDPTMEQARSVSSSWPRTATPRTSVSASLDFASSRSDGPRESFERPGRCAITPAGSDRAANRRRTILRHAQTLPRAVTSFRTACSSRATPRPRRRSGTATWLPRGRPTTHTRAGRGPAGCCAQVLFKKVRAARSEVPQALRSGRMNRHPGPVGQNRSFASQRARSATVTATLGCGRILTVRGCRRGPCRWLRDW